MTMQAIAWDASAGAAAEDGRFAAIEIFDSAEAAAQPWDELQDACAVSAFQTRGWAAAWAATIGRARGIAPMIVVARDAHGRAQALLPLGVVNRGPLRLAEFLGGKDANFTFGLFRPGPPVARAALAECLARAGKAGGVDLFALVNQPHDWRGFPNPFLALAHQTSPSFGHRATLGGDCDAFVASRMSSESRKKLRKKEARLRQLGALAHIHGDTPERARAILNAFLAQKRQRMKQKGIDNVFDGPGAHEFLDLATAGPAPAVELHGLAVGERVVATFAGAAHQGRFSGMFNSFDLDPEVARWSPGDLLLMRLIGEKCRQGFSSFDLGVGEARYKQVFCDESEPLFDAYYAATAAGRLLQTVKAGKRDLKRRVKQTPWLWSGLERLRRLRA